MVLDSLIKVGVSWGGGLPWGGGWARGGWGNHGK